MESDDGAVHTEHYEIQTELPHPVCVRACAELKVHVHDARANEVACFFMVG